MHPQDCVVGLTAHALALSGLAKEQEVSLIKQLGGLSTSEVKVARWLFEVIVRPELKTVRGNNEQSKC